ncbi:MAG: hypothetical protein BGO26_10205 [Actinobacteria bacterium 69-20]|nr:hypothetical protein [Actinomycetota bacterium]OJV23271.1 MAG: hypothetical protein BGO26_10205 [Actinobacteria bacterium 69-20]
MSGIRLFTPEQTEKLNRDMEAFAAGVRAAMARIADVMRAAGLIPRPTMRYIGGHWYPADHERMTARQYRAWKRMLGRQRAAAAELTRMRVEDGL